MRVSDIPVIDMFSAEDEQKAIRVANGGTIRGRDMVNAHNLIGAVAAVRRLQAGDSVNELGWEVSQSQRSKMLSVSATVLTEVVGTDVLADLPLGRGDVDVDKYRAFRNNLATFWRHENPTADFATFAAELIGDDGESRKAQVAAFVNTFGSMSSAYRVANGEVFHQNDPRAEQGSDDNQDDQDDDEQDDEQDDEKVSWQDRLAAVVKQATLEGAKPSEILAVVNANV